METLRYLVFMFALIFPALVSSQSEVLKPTSYRLKITIPDSPESNTFQGHVELEVKLSTTSSHLVLEAENLQIADSKSDISITKLKESRGAPPEVSGVNYTDTTLVIVCAKALTATGFKININFTGRFQNEMQGFAKVPFRFNGETQFLGVTSFQPNFARRVFPCSNDPSNKVNFELAVVVDHSQFVISNVKPTIHNISDTLREFVFNTYPAMPVHQLGWAVVNHSAYIRQERNTTDLKAIHTRTPRLYNNQATWTCQFTTNLMNELRVYLNESYPLDKLEQVLVPEFFSGTSQGYGILSYSEETFLVSPEQTSNRDKQKVALAIAGGIVGQWFGDYISMNSWKDMWLVKGISEYLKYYSTSKLDEMSSWELDDHVVVELIQKALSLDNTNNSLTIGSEDDQTIINIAYSEATKSKAAAIIRMLHNILGKDLFDKSLKYYVEAQSREENEGTPQDFWNMAYAAMTEEPVSVDLPSALSVGDIMDGWVALEGHPVVNVNINESHFLIAQAESLSTGSLQIPITYILQSSPLDVKRVWLNSNSILTIEKSSNQWILLNIDQTGFYRVNYHETLWAGLQEQLLSNHLVISRISRSQLIDDVFSFTTNGVLSMEFLMNFTKYLQKEVDYFPWYTAIRNFQNILDNVYGFPSYELLQKHLLSLMGGVVSTVGLKAKPTDSHTEKMRQSLVLEKACALGHSACQKQAVSILKSWMAETFYDRDLSMALLCAGVTGTSSDIWWKLRMSHDKSIYPTVRYHIIAALSCSTNVTLMNEFLTDIYLSPDPPLSIKEKNIFLETMASRPAGAELMLDWLLKSLSSETDQTVEPVSTATPILEVTTLESINNSSSSSEPVETLPTTGSPSTDTRSVEEAKSLLRTRRDVSETLTDNQIKSILNLVVPKLTTIEQGIKLERLLNDSNLPLSNETKTFIQNTAYQIHEKENFTEAFNGKLTVWLSNNVDLTSTSTSDSPTGSSGATISDSTTQKPANSAPVTLVHSSLPYVIILTSAILFSSNYYL